MIRLQPSLKQRKMTMQVDLRGSIQVLSEGMEQKLGTSVV